MCTYVGENVESCTSNEYTNGFGVAVTKNFPVSKWLSLTLEKESINPSYMVFIHDLVVSIPIFLGKRGVGLVRSTSIAF